MATVDLWPEKIALDGDAAGSPTALLKQQALLLGQKTDGLVEAEVTTAYPTKEGLFSDAFVIVSPELNYRYVLFEVQYPAEFFPAYVLWDGFVWPNVPLGTATGSKVDSQESFENALRKIFSHEKTLKIIQAIMSRSRH